MGIDWSSPESLVAQYKALSSIDFTLFGIMIWESVVTGWFDIEVIMGKRPFKIPVVMYWITKYSSLAFILGANVTQYGVRLNCQAAGSFIDVASGVGMAGASCLLMLRAMALWARDKRVVIPLLIVHLGLWALNLHDAFIVREHWGDTGNGSEGCVFTTLSWPYLKIQFIYAMLFDFLVLALATFALLRVPGRSSLWKLLFLDGLCYFLVAFVCYLATTVVVFLSVSIPLRWMFSDIANIFVAIAACRSFVRLATRADRLESISIEVKASASPPAPVRFAPRFYRPRVPSTASLSSLEDAKHDDEPQTFTMPSVHFPDAVMSPTHVKGDYGRDLEASYPDPSQVSSPRSPESGILVTRTQTQIHM